MDTLLDYFSSQNGEAFTSALPILRKQIACTPFTQRSNDCGVAGNTFRAYRGLPCRPSVVYREWAQSVCAALNPQLLSEEVATAEGFFGWHASLAESLQAHWIMQQGKELSFAHQHKLIDLFIKWLSGYDFDCRQLTDAFVSHANCALDSQTLTKLNECLSFALPISNPSMGDIHSRQTYEFCQSLISRFAHHYQGTPLLFDYFAWRPGGGG